MSKGWKQLDSLVLDSLGSPKSDGVGLAQIVGFVDYVDRSVLNHAELQCILSRLLGSGLAAETDLAYRRTDAGEEIHRRCPSSRPGDRSRWLSAYLEDFIDCRPREGWTLSDSVFRSAVASYLEEMHGLRDQGRRDT